MVACLGCLLNLRISFHSDSPLEANVAGINSKALANASRTSFCFPGRSQKWIRSCHAVMHERLCCTIGTLFSQKLCNVSVEGTSPTSDQIICQLLNLQPLISEEKEGEKKEYPTTEFDFTARLTTQSASRILVWHSFRRFIVGARRRIVHATGSLHPLTWNWFRR